MTATETALFTVRRAETALNPSLPPFGQFIGGAFVPSTSTSTVDVVNPATEEVLTQVPAGSAEDVDAAVAAAVAAKEGWAAKTPKDRSAAGPRSSSGYIGRSSSSVATPAENTSTMRSIVAWPPISS